MYNPVRFVAGQRRRHAVGAEFKYCPDGSQVAFDVDCPPGNGINYVGPGPTPGNGGGNGGSTPFRKPGGYDFPRYTPGGGHPIGDPYTPPTGTQGGGTPPVISTVPYVPPATTPGGGCGTPRQCAPVAQVCPENQKRIVMPFVPDAGYTASVTAGSEVRFVGRPQYLFKPERLIIASSIGPYFDVVNFIIGNKPQSLSQGNYSAEMYSEVATYVDMSFDQCYPGIDVVLVAKNKSAITQTFQAQLVGWADSP